MIKFKLHPMPAIRSSLFYLAMIPLLLGILGLATKNARGPMWLGSNLDPEYPYLLNSLNLTQFHAPYHNDHPGTPVQALGAVIIAAVHPFSRQQTLVQAVLKAPDWHLSAISLLFLFFCCVSLFTLGIAAHQAANSTLWAMVAQFTAGYCPLFLDETTRVRPEPIVIVLVTLLGTIILKFIPCVEIKSKLTYATLLGVLIGIAIASKVTAVPLLAIPLIMIDSFPLLGACLGAVGFSFMLGIMPLLLAGRTEHFLRWLLALFLHKGQYGTGQPGVIDPAAYGQAVVQLLAENKLAFAIIFGCMALVLFQRVHRTHPSDPASMRVERAFWALALAQVTQLLMTAKHPNSHYLIPSLGLLGVTLLLAYITLNRFRAKKWQPFAFGTAIFFLALGVVNLLTSSIRLWSIQESNKESQFRTNQAAATYQSNGWTIISYYRCSSVPYALSFGNDYTGHAYTKELITLYPDFIGYNIWKRSYSRFGEPIPESEVEQLGKKVIYRGAVKHIDIGQLKLETDVVQVFPGAVDGLYALSDRH